MDVYLKKAQLRSKGFTLPEVIISAAIFTIVSLAISYLVIRTSRVQESVLKIASNEVSFHSNVDIITADLKNSYIMRSRFFVSCPTQVLFTVDESSSVADRTKQLSAVNDTMEFVIADQSSVTSLIADPTIHLADAKKFKDGDFVAIFSTRESEFGNVFELGSISGSNADVVDSAGVSVLSTTAAISCAKETLLPKGNEPISNLFFNDSPAAMAYRIKVVKYKVIADPVDPLKKILQRTEWPSMEVSNLIEDFDKMIVTSTWTSFSSLSSKKGNLLFDIHIEHYRSSLVLDAATGKNLSSLEQVDVTTEYTISTGGRTNLGANPGSMPELPSFPTCLVKVEQENLFYTTPVSYPAAFCTGRPYPNFSNSKVYRVRGSMGGTNTAGALGSMQVFIQPDDPTSSAVCYSMSSNDPDYYAPTGAAGGLGYVCGLGTPLSFPINLGLATQADYACAIKGDVTFSGTLSLYDSKVGLVKGSDCTPGHASFPYVFKFDVKPYCVRTGAKSAGSLVNFASGAANTGVNLNTQCRYWLKDYSNVTRRWTWGTRYGYFNGSKNSFVPDGSLSDGTKGYCLSSSEFDRNIHRLLNIRLTPWDTNIIGMGFTNLPGNPPDPKWPYPTNTPVVNFNPDHPTSTITYVPGGGYDVVCE